MPLLDQLPPPRPVPEARFHAAQRQLEGVVSGTTRLRPWRMTRRTVAGLGLGIVLAGGGAAAAYLPSSPSGYTQVSANGRTVGDAPTADLHQPAAGSGPIPVYSRRNLRKMVGHLYPGIGFVPLGTSPTLLPCRALKASSVTIGTTGAKETTTQAIPCPSVSVVLPNVVGLSTPTAAGKLSSLGVSVYVVNVASVSPPGTVVTMSPAAGTRVSARSTVTIDNAKPSGAE